MRKFVTVICVLWLAACSTIIETPQPALAGVEVQASQVNTQAKLEPTTGMLETFSYTGVLELNLRNVSDEALLFPADFGAKILFDQAGRWVPVQNRFTYPSGGFLIAPEKEEPMGAVVDVMPVLPSSKGTVRVVIVGRGKDSGKVVAAFLDVSIGP